MAIVGALIVLGALLAMASGRVPAALALATALAVAGDTVVTPAADLAAPIDLLSALINTTPIVAMLIPATRELEQTRAIPARQVLLPITHATTLTGSITLIGTSSNLIIAGLAAPLGVDMGMLSFAPVALPVAIVGIVLLAALGPRLLGAGPPRSAASQDWRVEMPVADGANAAGRQPAELGRRTTTEYTLTHLNRGDRELDPSRTIESGDTRILTATERGIRALWNSPRFGLPPQHRYAASVAPGVKRYLLDLQDDDSDLQVVAAQTSRPFAQKRAMPGSTCFVTTRPRSGWRPTRT